MTKDPGIKGPKISTIVVMLMKRIITQKRVNHQSCKCGFSAIVLLFLGPSILAQSGLDSNLP